VDSKLVYVGADQDLSSVAAGLRDLREEERLALVVPPGARAFENPGDLEALHRQAALFGQQLSVITSDASLQSRAGQIGLRTFSGLEAYDRNAPESPIPASEEHGLAVQADPPTNPSDGTDGSTSELESPLQLGLRAGWRGVREHGRPITMAALAMALIAVIGFLLVPGATVTLILAPSRVRSDVQLTGSAVDPPQDGHFRTQVIDLTESQTLRVAATGSRTIEEPAGTRIGTVVQQSDIDMAARTLTARLDVAIQTDLAKKAPGLRLVAVGAPAYSQPDAAAVGAEVSAFDLTETESIQVVAFDDRVVRQMLRDQVRRAVPAGYALSETPIQTWYEVLTAQPIGSITINGHAAAYARVDLRVGAVRTTVRGHTPAEARARLALDPRVTGSTVSQHPLPMPWLPVLGDRISVRTVDAPRNAQPSLKIDLTGDGAPTLSGRLTEAGGDLPIPGARIEISYQRLDGGGDFAEYTLEGTVPAPATQALVGLPVNTENGGPGPSDLSIYQMAYSENGESGNRVPNANFSEGLQPWASWGTGAGHLMPSDRGDGQMLNVTTTSEQSAWLNSSAFGVTAGKRFKVTVAARIAPASAGSGYFTVIWLYGSEFKRQTIPIKPAPPGHVFVATDDGGAFRYDWPGLPTGRIVLTARWAGDDTRSPVIASITR